MLGWCPNVLLVPKSFVGTKTLCCCPNIVLVSKLHFPMSAPKFSPNAVCTGITRQISSPLSVLGNTKSAHTQLNFCLAHSRPSSSHHCTSPSEFPHRKEQVQFSCPLIAKVFCNLSPPTLNLFPFRIFVSYFFLSFLPFFLCAFLCFFLYSSLFQYFCFSISLFIIFISPSSLSIFLSSYVSVFSLLFSVVFSPSFIPSTVPSVAIPQQHTYRSVSVFALTSPNLQTLRQKRIRKQKDQVKCC